VSKTKTVIRSFSLHIVKPKDKTVYDHLIHDGVVGLKFESEIKRWYDELGFRVPPPTDRTREA
jgi:hypothetical protein